MGSQTIVQLRVPQRREPPGSAGASKYLALSKIINLLIYDVLRLSRYPMETQDGVHYGAGKYSPNTTPRSPKQALAGHRHAEQSDEINRKNLQSSRRRCYQREWLKLSAWGGRGRGELTPCRPPVSPGSLPRVSLRCHGDKSTSGIPLRFWHICKFTSTGVSASPRLLLPSPAQYRGFARVSKGF